MDGHSEMAAPVLTGSTEDLAQHVTIRSEEDLRQSQKHDLNVPVTNADVRGESIAEPMMTMEDIRNHATTKSPNMLIHFTLMVVTRTLPSRIIQNVSAA